MKYNKIFTVTIIVIVLTIAALILFLQKSKPAVDNPPTNKTVPIFFGNSQKNPNAIDCAAVFSVNRTVALNAGYEALLNQLFAGPTNDEQVQGYYSFFSSSTADTLINVKIVNDTAYINLKDLRTMSPNASTSCGNAEFLSEIKNTLEQDGKIKKIILAINTDPAPLYKWLQLGCTPETNNCDTAPFK